MNTFAKAKDLAEVILIFMNNLKKALYLLEIEWGWNMTIATVISFIWALLETFAPIWLISGIGFVLYRYFRKNL